jgi:site-specific DNA-methyltransferase (adenine-specific)
MKRITDKSIDMILCDLPYGTTACKWDSIIPYEKLWEQYNRIIKDKGAIVLHCEQPFTTTLINSNLKNYKYSWIWYKHQVSGFLNAKKQPLRNCEDIAVFYKKQPTYNPQMTKGKMQLKNTGGDSKNYNKFEAQPHYSNEYYPTSLLDFPLKRFKNGHPTQKPVELEEYLISTYTNEGEIVLDNCMGSGTTAIACININRNYIGFELDNTYYNLAKERINKHIISENMQGKYQLIA